MERIELDLLRAERRARWPALALLAIALAFAGDLLRTYQSLDRELSAKEVRLAGAGVAGPTRARPAVTTPISAEEYEFARATVRRLSTPWANLFQALETAHSDRVALLAVEPDAESGTVNLSGEAKDYLSVLSYVTTLEDQKELKRVHLARHELKQGTRDRPVSFTVTAAWRERR
jgi:type IV pilus assembly PilN-like protein